MKVKGGIAVLWREGIDLQLRSKSKYHIDMEVTMLGEAKWRFTGIYGEAKSELKTRTWETLRRLFSESSESLPWLCTGDFNEILYHHEKEGGVPRAQAFLDRFKGVLEECELHDLGFVGDVFTWRNKQDQGCSHTRERLDRAVANADWRMRFTLVQVRNGDPFHSDHRSVIINTEPRQRQSGVGRNSPFHFEASWLQEEVCREIVENMWGDGET